MRIQAHPICNFCRCPEDITSSVVDINDELMITVTKLSHCSICKSVRYCSKQCQKQDWTKHKLTCKSTNLNLSIIDQSVQKKVNGFLTTIFVLKDKILPVYIKNNYLQITLHYDSKNVEKNVFVSRDKIRSTGSRNAEYKEHKQELKSLSVSEFNRYRLLVEVIMTTSKSAINPSNIVPVRNYIYVLTNIEENRKLEKTALDLALRLKNETEKVLNNFRTETEMVVVYSDEDDETDSFELAFTEEVETEEVKSELPVLNGHLKGCTECSQLFDNLKTNPTAISVLEKMINLRIFTKVHPTLTPEVKISFNSMCTVLATEALGITENEHDACREITNHISPKEQVTKTLSENHSFKLRTKHLEYKKLEDQLEH